MKTCSLCKNSKKKEEFGICKRNKDGRHSWCKSCKSIKNRAYRYGLSVDDIRDMLYKQDNKCAICLDDIHEFHVDHDRRCCENGNGRNTCGRCVRGLLCIKCNTLVGLVERNSNQILENTKNYLGNKPL